MIQEPALKLPSDPFEDGDWKPPPFRWWDWREWRHRTAMRGFDDGICWGTDEDRNAPKSRYYKPPLILFRKAYIFEFWEGASK